MKDPKIFSYSYGGTGNEAFLEVYNRTPQAERGSIALQCLLDKTLSYNYQNITRRNEGMRTIPTIIIAPTPAMYACIGGSTAGAGGEGLHVRAQEWLSAYPQRGKFSSDINGHPLTITGEPIGV